MKILFLAAILSATVLTFFAPVASSEEKEKIEMPTPIEGEMWEYIANTINPTHSSSDAMNGEYRITYRGGSCEAIQIRDGTEYVASTQVAGHLRRLIAVCPDGDNRKYLAFDLFVGKKWGPIEFSSQVPGGNTRLDYKITYEVKENVATAEMELLSLQQEKLAPRKKNFYPSLKIKGGGPVNSPRRTWWGAAWVLYYAPGCSCIARYYYNSATDNENSSKTDFWLTRHIIPGKDLTRTR